MLQRPAQPIFEQLCVQRAGGACPKHTGRLGVQLLYHGAGQGNPKKWRIFDQVLLQRPGATGKEGGLPKRLALDQVFLCTRCGGECHGHLSPGAGHCPRPS